MHIYIYYIYIYIFNTLLYCIYFILVHNLYSTKVCIFPKIIIEYNLYIENLCNCEYRVNK